MIRLIVFLDLQRTPNGYLITRQEDHILWTESFQRTFPILHRVWCTHVTRWIGLAIVFLMQVIHSRDIMKFLICSRRN